MGHDVRQERMREAQEARAACRQSQEMIGKLLDLVALNCAQRSQAQAYGEVTIRIQWENGRVKNVRFVEESIMRSVEEIAERKALTAGEAGA